MFFIGMSKTLPRIHNIADHLFQRGDLRKTAMRLPVKYFPVIDQYVEMTVLIAGPETDLFDIIGKTGQEFLGHISSA